MQIQFGQPGAELLHSNWVDLNPEQGYPKWGGRGGGHTTKRLTSKKAPVKKALSKKAPGNKAPSKKSSGKKASGKKAPSKKAPI